MTAVTATLVAMLDGAPWDLDDAANLDDARFFPDGR